jgi:ribosome-binding protein aMBF1 (putative translation factor)
MIICDVCGEPKDCAQREIEGREYDICAECWKPLAEKLKGKGRAKREREIVLLPSTQKEPEREQPKPGPGGPPTIWGSVTWTQ